MMAVITSLANFFYFSPKRQKCFEDNVAKYPESKLVPLCRTHWVERLNALEVTLELIEAVVDTLVEMSENSDKNWNRDTVTQSYSLLKGIDFEFLITLVVAQRVLAFTSGITAGLQTRGIDFANVTGQVKLIIRTLQATRSTVDSFHSECFQYACGKAKGIDVDIKKPRTCNRQRNRSNASLSSDSTSESNVIEQYFRINLTIPFLDEVLESLERRFAEGQGVVLRGIWLIPSYVVACENWEESIDPFIQHYSDELLICMLSRQSCQHGKYYGQMPGKINGK